MGVVSAQTRASGHAMNGAVGKERSISGLDRGWSVKIEYGVGDGVRNLYNEARSSRDVKNRLTLCRDVGCLQVSAMAPRCPSLEVYFRCQV